MKKTLLNFGCIAMMFLVIFGCHQEQEYGSSPEDQLKLKGDINQNKDEENTDKEVSVGDLLYDQHNYLTDKITKDFNYYEVVPVRRSTHWFQEHFDYLFKENEEIYEWILQHIETEEIAVFGITVDHTTVASLVFTDGLEVPREFENKAGLMLDTTIADGCEWVWCSWGSDGFGTNCHCWSTMCCDWESSWCYMPCPDENKTIETLDMLFPDEWGIDFKLLIDTPAFIIEIDQPVLPY